MLLKYDNLSAEKWEFDVADYLEELHFCKSAATKKLSERLKNHFSEASLSSTEAEAVDDSALSAHSALIDDEDRSQSKSEDSCFYESDESSGEEENYIQEQSKQQCELGSGVGSMAAQDQPHLNPNSVIASVKPLTIAQKSELRKAHFELYHKLVDSFHYQLEAKQVVWLRQSVDSRHRSLFSPHRPPSKS